LDIADTSLEDIDGAKVFTTCDVNDEEEFDIGWIRIVGMVLDAGGAAEAGGACIIW
jgi:hypothetical protein